VGACKAAADYRRAFAAIADPKKPASAKRPVPQHIEWAWKIVSRPPTLSFIELNKESFLQLMLEVSNA
jgi:hypothetical protein